MPKKTKLRVKDISPKSGQAKDVKGGRQGGVGPCDRK